MAQSKTVLVSLALQEIAAAIDQMMAAAGAPGVTWSLFVWTEGRANYVGNCSREDMIPVLQAILDSWKGDRSQPDIPAHEVM